MTNELDRRFYEARRRYISAQFPNLNEMQAEAALTTEGPLLLLAGAGSGKTTVLINRIANLIRFGCGSDTQLIPDDLTEEDVQFLESFPAEPDAQERERADALCAVNPVAPWNIIAITFTNKAANELKERLHHLVGEGGEDVWAMTFHSACCRILRRNIERLGYTSRFTIYDSADSERIMKDILKAMGLDDKTFPVKYVLAAISREKDNYCTPEELLERAEDEKNIKSIRIAQAYQAYQKKLFENNALDFDDIIFMTVRLLQEHEDVRRYYQNKFRYVLVDEYQDTNHMQYLLSSLLAGGHRNICVVGDDDQSIYRFRGATIENILDFEKQYRGCRTIRLEQNYRSTQCILDAANAVISHNHGRKGKRLWTANPSGAPVLVYTAADQMHEANFVAGQILKKLGDCRYADYAILYRTNAQSNALEQALRAKHIPYRIIGGTRFFDRAEIKDVLAYLHVINNRSDDLRLKRIINNPPRGLGAKTIDTVQRLADASTLPLYNVISDPYSYGPLEKASGKLMQFTIMLESLAKSLDEGMPLPEFYDELIERTGYVRMLEQKPTEENKTRLENVRELKSSIQNYVNGSAEPTLAGFLEEISLYTDIEEYDDRDDTVILMTMHSAKGLEFSHVFITGFEDGLFPGMRAIGDQEEMEEERRLCYVAITRAKKTLTITHAKQRMLYGRTSAALASRFLKEIPDSCLLRKGSGYHKGDFGYGYHDPFSRPVSTGGYSLRTAFQQTPQKPCPEYRVGELVEHNTFGRGLILTVHPMGGDALLEVAFDQVGTKKLMAKTASNFMKKLS